MVVYITYDRYEHNEWFNVYHVGTDRQESYNKCIEEDLPNFLSYGPDDCHFFQLVGVEMKKSQFKKLLQWVEEIGSCDGSEDDTSFYDFMCDLYEGSEGFSEVVENLVSTDGCSDCFELVRFYCQMKGLEPEDVDDDVEYELQCELCEDNELFQKVVKEYVRTTY